MTRTELYEAKRITHITQMRKTKTEAESSFFFTVAGSATFLGGENFIVSVSEIGNE